MQLEAKLQRYMDSEDRRVKELTEGVLYELLPSALNVMLPHCEDPLQELDAERCRVSDQQRGAAVRPSSSSLASAVVACGVAGYGGCAGACAQSGNHCSKQHQLV